VFALYALVVFVVIHGLKRLILKSRQAPWHRRAIKS